MPAWAVDREEPSGIAASRHRHTFGKMSATIRTKQPLSRIGACAGGNRLANELTHLADVRNHSTLSRLIRASGIPRRTIPMYWFSRVPNLGNALSRVVVEHLSRATPVLVAENFPGKLLACGSILSKAAGDWVWGAGACGEPITHRSGVVFSRRPGTAYRPVDSR